MGTIWPRCFLDNIFVRTVLIVLEYHVCRGGSRGRAHSCVLHHHFSGALLVAGPARAACALTRSWREAGGRARRAVGWHPHRLGAGMAEVNCCHLSRLVVDHHHGDDTAMRVWVAAQEGRTEDLQGLLRTLQESESTSVINTAKALCVAARNDHVGAVRVLLAATADANEDNRSGITPMCVAAREGHCDVIPSGSNNHNNNNNNNNNNNWRR